MGDERKALEGLQHLAVLLSLLTGRPAREGVAITGEVTLRGRVLPVGGIREKVLAAHRAGMRAVILPRRNERDLEELPAAVRAGMEFVLVEELAEAFAFLALDRIDRAARRAA